MALMMDDFLRGLAGLAEGGLAMGGLTTAGLASLVLELISDPENVVFSIFLPMLFDDDDGDDDDDDDDGGGDDDDDDDDNYINLFLK